MRAFDLAHGWPGDPAAIAVVAGGATDALGPVDAVRPWASVTKVLTAIAVLVAVEDGSLGLDDPAGPPGATVRHLLAHASGLAPDANEPIAAVGTRRIYSNAGFEVLGGLLASRTGIAAHDYVTEAVIEPLGMHTTSLRGSVAHGAAGSLTDLVALARELSAPTLLARETWAAATSVQQAGLDGVLPGFGAQHPCDWGLGLEIRGTKHPHWTGRTNSTGTFGHFGRSGSFLWVDPAHAVAVAALAGAPFGTWAATAWPELADAVLGELGLTSGEGR